MKELQKKIVAEFKVFSAESQIQVDKGNASAGKRSRKSANALSHMLKEWRAMSTAAGKSEE